MGRGKTKMGKIDPRVIKTRRKLKNAFLTLLSSQRLSEMNVKDLTQTADVTRGTFYLHYKDKETFIQIMMEELIAEFFEAAIFNNVLDEEEQIIQPVLSLVHTFEYVGARPDFFTVLLREADALPYQEMFSNQLFDYIQEHQEKNNDLAESKVPKALLMSFLTYGVLGYIDSWLSDGKIYANHFMAINLEKLLDSTLIAEAGLENFFVTDATELPNIELKN